MNRTIMLLIPIVILAAMGLILFQQMWSSDRLEPESVAGGQADLPYSDSSVPTPLSSAELDEAIRREQMNRTQSAPELPPLEGATATLPPAGQDAAAPGVPDSNASRSELGRLADATLSGQPQTTGNTAADDLARQVAAGESGGSQTTAPQAPVETPAPPQNTANTAPQTTPPAPVEAPKPVLDKFTMTGITLKAEGSDMILTLTADKHFTYKSFILTGPDRLVVDLIGEWSGVKIPGMPSNRLISKVREGKFDGSHRIVMDLKGPLAGYETKRLDDNTVTVRLY